jgi:hypothetical protein
MTRKGPWVVAAFSLFFGAFSFTSVARRPRFEAIHTLDVLQLMIAGVFIGIALASVGAMAGLRRTRSQ